ncbi:MAGUK p55 subfamily member 4-like isoform X2 [Oncorhynchus clarkii lewisi]
MRQAVEAESVMSSPRPSDHGLRQILSDVVEEVKHSINKEINGAKLLNSLLNAPWLKSLLQVYECLQQHQREPAAPFLPYTTQLIQQILADLRTVRNTSAEARELYSLLRGPHFQALTSAHDTVAQKDYNPVLPPIPDNLSDDEEAMRIVCLVKNKQQLGATIKRNGITGEIFVARMIHGGLADRGGLLHAGDRITEVNGYSVDGLEPEQVIETLARSQGTLVSKVVSITDRPVSNQTICVSWCPSCMCLSWQTTVPSRTRPFPAPRQVWTSGRETCWRSWTSQTPSGGRPRNYPAPRPALDLSPPPTCSGGNRKSSGGLSPTSLHQTLTVNEDKDLMAIDEKSDEAEEGEFSTNIEGIYLTGFRRSLRLCRRQSLSTGSSQQSCYTRCSGSCYSALNNPYEEVVRYQCNPQDKHRLITLVPLALE